MWLGWIYHHYLFWYIVTAIGFYIAGYMTARSY
jgi:hypothetical protein